MKSANNRVLGLFPYFGPDTVGGVQASAAIAWGAISAHAKGLATLLVYATEDRTKMPAGASETLIVHSKVEAVVRVLSRRWAHSLIFVWHLGLLRLLPFFRFSKVRVVVMLLGIEAWKEQRGLTRKQLERVDLFLSISDHTWREFIRFNPLHKSKPHQTLLLGIGTPLEGEAAAPDERPAALMLSRLSRDEDYKGHREVVSAWSRVLERMPVAELWIVGEGDLRGDLERLVAERGLEEQVRFWGLVSEDVKQELLERCRCLVMPSRAEGFGLVYLEAMRLGRPCLVSTLDAGRQIVNPPEAGLAVDPDDEGELADSIIRLLTDGPEWRSWSEQARRRYEDNYTAKHFEERLLDTLFPDRVVNRTEQESAFEVVSA